MKAKITTTIRIALGLLLVVFGLNHLLNFIPMPAPPEAALPYWGGIMSAKFIIPTVMIIEVLAGLSLLLNRYTKLFLLLMIPVTYNFLMFHLFLDPMNIGGAALVTILHSYLLYKNFDDYKSLIK
jgi:uncharacterized membrane protein YphA (DoxX/SURF4 family)